MKKLRKTTGLSYNSPASTLFSLFSNWFQSFITLLYPNRCPVCSQIPPPHSLICPACYTSIHFVKQPFCYSCGKPLASKEQEYCYDCLRHPKSFTRGYSLAIYDSVTKPSLMAIKYKNKSCYLQFYAQETLKAYGKLFCRLAPDAILPVPIHPKRLKKRGYNQASLFAHNIGKSLQIPVYDSLLVRTINTLPQKNLTPEQRLLNLQKAFSLYPGYELSLLPFQRVLLVDDIYTTGSTMEALTRLLKNHGVKEVYIFSICIGNGF